MRDIQTHRILRRVVVAVFAMLLAGGASLADARDGVTEVLGDSIIREFLESFEEGDTAPAKVQLEEAVPQSNHTTRAKVAALLNLSPGRSWVHLFCDQTVGACAVTFWCGQQTGDPVTWDVSVPAGRIFTYYPGKPDSAGGTADFEAALVAAGLTDKEALLRTTCTVRSNDSVEARAYSSLAGEILSVTNQAPATSSPPDPQPQPQSLSSGSYTMEWTARLCADLGTGERIRFPFTLTVSGSSFSGRHSGRENTIGVTWFWNGTISSSGRITGRIRIGEQYALFTGQIHGSRSASGAVETFCRVNWRIY